MKFNFKKIASVLTGAVMVSSTIALAAAANFPAPFVSNGAGDFAVVYGSGTSLTDGVAAADINSWLNAKVTTVTPPVTPGNLTGEVVPLFKSNNKLNLGDNLNSVYTSIKSDKLPTILADETFSDEDGTEYEYSQKIDLGGVALSHFASDDFDPNEVPVLGYELVADTNILNYTVTFSDALTNDSALLKTNNINLLGKEWYISNVEDQGAKITLLDTSNTISMIEGATQTVGAYEITVDSVEQGTTLDKATLVVNGKSYTITEGSSKKIGTDTYLAVTNAIYSEKKDSKVEFTIGSGSLVLEDGTTAVLNDESVDDLNVEITQAASGYITEIQLLWTTSEVNYLIPGKELVMPGLGAVKLSYTGFTFGPEEVTKIRYSGDTKIELQDVEVEDGSVTVPLVYANDTAYVGLGKDATHKLLTDDTAGNPLSLDEAVNPYFVVTWVNDGLDDWESYLFQLESISKSGDENITKIKNIGDGTTLEFKSTGAEVAPEKDVGEVTLTMTDVLGTESTGTLTATAASGTVYTDVLVTKGGLWIELPVDGQLNETTMPLWLQEANKDGDLLGAGSGQFNITLGLTTDGKTEVTDVDSNGTTLTINADSDNEQTFVPGELATKIVRTAADDRPTVDITYHTSESSANVYIAEAAASTGTSGGSGSSGWLPVKDTEVSGVSSKNLLVVGGSCVNTVAAKLLGSDTPLCEAAWMTATNNVGAGSFLIKTYVNPYAATKIATLVAGYDAADTVSAVNALKVQDVDTTIGKEYVGRAGQTLTLVT